MNAKTLAASLALALAATPALAAETPRVDHIVDLPAVEVRPDPALRAELAANRIVDLPAVVVRPTTAQKAEYLAVQAMQGRIVDLATVYVRPTAEQLAERAAIVAREQAEALAVRVGNTLAGQAQAHVGGLAAMGN
ncbi:hypothetical protein [Pseudoxanthomonas sp. GW2]|uniref:hypothetical protein n=1 Tax=Pseudoxanthomonas sp. GW2 TaxID=1211114 RepID=UPI000317DA45|nr:hypothetical protein [Pseudoxanthomonas sp. GW2]